MDAGKEIGDTTHRRALVLSGGGGRGAFECGAIEELTRIGWRPDVLVGTSIGSMNAAVWALDGAEGVGRMWNEIRTRDMHRLFRLRSWQSLFDRTAWKRTLEKYAPEERLRQVTTPLYIVATDIGTGHPVVFTNAEDLDGSKPFYQKVDAITHDHLLASSAIPYVYPKVLVEQVDHWDGAVMYNSPLRPAVDADATEILVVLLSPYHDLLVPKAGLPPTPGGIIGRAGHLLDLAITATFENDFEQMRKINKRVREGRAGPGYKEIRCGLIGPDRWLTVLDMIRYRKDRATELRRQGAKAVGVTWARIAAHGWDSQRW